MERLDAVVAVDVDGSDIDRIAQTAVPVTGGIQLASRLDVELVAIARKSDETVM